MKERRASLRGTEPVTSHTGARLVWFGVVMAMVGWRPLSSVLRLCMLGSHGQLTESDIPAPASTHGIIMRLLVKYTLVRNRTSGKIYSRKASAVISRLSIRTDAAASAPPIPALTTPPQSPTLHLLDWFLFLGEDPSRWTVLPLAQPWQSSPPKQGTRYRDPGLLPRC